MKCCRLIAILVVLVVILQSFPVTAAEQVQEPEVELMALTEPVYGSCGDTVSWSLTTDGVLTISGTGTMDDFSAYGTRPGWYPYRDSVTSLYIQEGVTSIGDSAFNACDALTSVTISASVTQIGNSAFNRCASLSSITIPASVTQIGHRVFNVCTSLSSITIPASVTDIGLGVFSDCSSLREIVVAEENEAYSSKDGVLLNKDQTVLLSYPVGNSRTSYAIPDTVTTISEYAFEYCGNLEAVTIPEAVTSIGECAFNNCTGLKEITLPGCVTEISYLAFSGCTGLTAVTMLGPVSKIDSYAFSGCTTLTTVKMLGSGTYVQIKDGAFYGCIELTTVTILGTVRVIENLAFYGTKLSRVHYMSFPNSWGEFNEPLSKAGRHKLTVSHVSNKNHTHTTDYMCSSCNKAIESLVQICIDGNDDGVCDNCRECWHKTTKVRYVYQGKKSHMVEVYCALCDHVTASVAAACSDEDGDKLCDWCETTMFCKHTGEVEQTCRPNGDGTHALVTVCTFCKEDVFVTNQTCTDGNGDGLCDVCAHDLSLGACRIHEIVVTDKAGKPLDSLPAETVLVTVRLTDRYDGKPTMVLLAAYTAEGQYRGLMHFEVSHETENATASVTLPFDNADGGAAKLKVFAVNSLADVTPVGGVVEFG